MNTPIFHEVTQGSPDWYTLRRGVITSSIVGDLITPTGKIANNATSRACLAELLAQRLTGFSDTGFVTFDMQRGIDDESYARALYAVQRDAVREIGFVTREVVPGVVIGCSPDGLVGNDGGIEIKSRRPKIQIATILAGVVPGENIMQIQTCMLITGRTWWDYISYSGGLPMVIIRVHADPTLHAQIIEAATMAERAINDMRAVYNTTCERNNWGDTERVATEIET